MSNSEHSISGDEIKKEFQLERMILFSDAVFAIVITLMAIEIKIPDSEAKLSNETIVHELHHLLPVIFAYIVSFFFIGAIWYQHLRIFSLVKDYDKGLVVRNLVLLFFIGLFPFSAAIVTRSRGNSFGFYIYFGIVLCCIVTQYLLQYYILVQRPALRIQTNLQEHLFELKKKKALLIGFVVAFILSFLTFRYGPTPDIKALAPAWVVPIVVIYRFYVRKNK